MDHDDTRGADTGEDALDRLLERATVSALSALYARFDLARRLRHLHNPPHPPAADDQTGGAVP